MANPKIEVEIGAKTKEFNDKLRDVRNDLDKTGKSFGKLNDFATGALQGIASAFTVGAIVNFGKAVIDTTAQFQKFEAVLTNTLGSNSAAQVALNRITEFASKTPFQVEELTDSFVKLANQGFVPTVNQLRQLGDLAASTGKSFDQLAEALIDAQVGEFERLKEFGIRASKEGDKVKFTFKGVETTVKATDSAIRDYILSLGDLEGVSGSTAAISATVGGQISNLGDNFTQLLKVVGDSSSGLISSVLTFSNEALSSLISKLDAVNTVAAKTGENGFLTFLKRISAIVNPAYAQSLEIQAGVIKKVEENAVEAAGGLSGINDSIKEAAQSFDDFKKAQDSINKRFFADLALNAQIFNKALDEQNRLLEGIASKSEEILNAQSRRVGIFDQQGNLTGTQTLAGINPQVQDVGVDTSGFNPSEQAQQLPLLDQILGEILLKTPKIEERLTTFAFNVNDILQNQIGGAFISLGDNIGQALATGGNVIQAIGQSLLQSIAGFLGQLGEQLILFGVAGGAFGKLSLALTNPLTAIQSAPLAIAAGVALTAAAGAIGSIGRKGIGGGSSVGSSGVSGGTSQNFGGSGLESSFINGLQVSGLVEIDGTKILIALENAEKKRNRG